MHRLTLGILLPFLLGSCVSPFVDAKLGRMSASVHIVWVGADNFVFVPAWIGTTFTFETARTGRLIAPGLMYTDGGSIPRVAQIFPAFSPWAYGPAYIIHDWIFYGRHCYVDRELPQMRLYNDAARFDDVNGDETKPSSHPRHDAITFDESALILAEVIKTMVDWKQVQSRNVAADLISSAVDSPVALASWNASGRCDAQRVIPYHIAIVWLQTIGEGASPPPTWKLSPYEIAEARRHFTSARKFIRQLDPNAVRPKQAATKPDVALAQ
jgi:hypothetical protein